MTTISAKAILVSRNVADPDLNRKLSTILCRYPRWVHAELMTHRAFSRNAASSRAIPVERMVQGILDDPAVPLFWGRNQRGMQAGEECNELITLPFSGDSVENEQAWLMARDNAINMAQAFDKAGYHKQIVNRLLEPFMHITTLISATEWDNFFALRIHKDAEPHIRLLAEHIKRVIDTASVQVLKPGQWHLPFVGCDEIHDLDLGEVSDAIKLSMARCASTSFKTVEGFDMTLERAIALHNKLVGSVPMHASPAEHPAQADGFLSVGSGWEHSRDHRNFVGFRQYRASLPGECVSRYAS